MKKITIILILLISLTNCGVKKTKILEQRKIENLIDSLNYNVILPENWKPILDSHDLLSYSPRNLGDIFYKNIVRIYETKTTEIKEDSLSNLVQEEIKGWHKRVKIVSQNLTRANTKYGETYTYIYEHDWNFTHYKDTFVYFKYNGILYKFNYSSDIRFYEKYKNDVIFILNNLKFKEKE